VAQPTAKSLEKLLNHQPLIDFQLAGKFHAHLSVEAADSDLDQLKDFCAQRKVKLTVIELENLEGRAQSDVMTTSHYRIETPDAVSQITQHLIELTEQLTDAGYSVLRAKLEHESLPTLSQFNQTQYHEVHVKLRLPAADYESGMETLKRLGQQYCFVPSRNPYDRQTDFVVQFINLRIYDGSRSEADSRINKIVDIVKQQDFEVIEVKRETVVYDTHQALDSWWTQS